MTYEKSPRSLTSHRTLSWATVRFLLVRLLTVLTPALCAEAAFTNSATLTATLRGTNLVVGYSTTTTQGWVTLLSADRLDQLGSNPQTVARTPTPASKSGEFVVPLTQGAAPGFYQLLMESWPRSLMNFPNLSDVMPPGQIFITGTGTSRQFQYTHDTFNGGPGPLEIQPFYNSASGNYQGYQHIYSFYSNRWILVRSVPVAGAFVFHAAHGHFHFPFASYGLYRANPDGTIGNPMVLSEKVGFCIADSFIYDPTLPHAGEFGNWGQCGDPTSLRGISIGAVDEYDRTDDGQSIPIGNIPDGTYWLRAIVDPNNFFEESDKSNNETDVKLTISGTSVTILQEVVPVLPPPPKISLSSPGPGTVSGVVPLTANSPVSPLRGVQFLVDGLPFGNIVPVSPYTLYWDTTAVQEGSHWLAAQAITMTGQIGTSEVILVNVNNTVTNAPIVHITSPTPNAIVSAIVTISATAAAQVGVPSVQFYVDDVPLGSPDTDPPFLAYWNTEQAEPGPHQLSAIATDQAGLVGYSAEVTVNVDNSHPPLPLGIDVLVFADTSDQMQTPAFSTTAASEMLVAFVAYDGPSSSAQTATVSGAGLVWQLMKRSNVQSGTSEIWVAQTTNLLSSVTVISQPGTPGYHGSLTVITFTNASGPGTVGQASAPSGAPSIYLPGISSGNWVFAVGNDWDGAIARTPVSGQVLVHQRVDTMVGDTFWVQSTDAPTTISGLVEIRDTAPTTHQWNYAAIEIVAARQ